MSIYSLPYVDTGNSVEGCGPIMLVPRGTAAPVPSPSALP
jgi:hypothetical protein